MQAHGCILAVYSYYFEMMILDIFFFPLFALVICRKSIVHATSLIHKRGVAPEILREVKVNHDPQLDPKWKNKTNIVLNNCYNFAVDQLSSGNGPARPGRANNYDIVAANMPNPFDRCEPTRSGVIKDGLKNITPRQFIMESAKDKKCRYIALYVSPKREIPGFYQDIGDFHFYRLMKPGVDKNVREELWFHKVGEEPPRTSDFSGKKIKKFSLFSPTFNAGNYTLFCGFFRLCENVKIQ
jgi:hypothetical protein